MKKAACIFVLIAFLFALVGCATIICGRTQELPVVSSPTGAIVTIGSMKQQTPATFILDRRIGVYQVTIEKEGYEPVTVTLKKGVNGWVFGNIIFGGLIGLVIDIASGSAAKFTPSEVEVNLVKKELKESGINLKNRDILIVKLKEEIE